MTISVKHTPLAQLAQHRADFGFFSAVLAWPGEVTIRIVWS